MLPEVRSIRRAMIETFLSRKYLMYSQKRSSQTKHNFVIIYLLDVIWRVVLIDIFVIISF